MCNILFYATETYIMHFLEASGFLDAPVLAGPNVNVLHNPGLAGRPLCSHLHKITNEPIFLYGACPFDFDAGQRHYLGNWKGWALKILPVLGLPLPIAA